MVKNEREVENEGIMICVLLVIRREIEVSLSQFHCLHSNAIIGARSCESTSNKVSHSHMTASIYRL